MFVFSKDFFVFSYVLELVWKGHYSFSHFYRKRKMSHILEKTEFLQFPLVVQNEAVTSRPPTSQVLLAADVGHGGVQHPPSSPLHS